MADGVATKAESSLAVFFETKIMDAAERTSATIPALISNDNEDAVEAHSIHDTLLLMDIYGFCIAHILNYIKNRFELDLDDARRIVEHSAFVMPSRSKLFETGINAGFQEDFITAINIMVAYLTATATTEQGGSFTCSLPFSTCAVHGWIVTSSG